MKNEKPMQMFVFNGYSGVGKTMIMESLVYGINGTEPIKNITNLVTCTTRKPRIKPVVEIDGKHYNFLTKKQFDELKLISNFDELSFYDVKKICEAMGYKDCIVEETNYAGITYGLLYSEIRKIFDANKHAIGIFDIHGVGEMKRIFGTENVHSIFVYRDLQEVRKEIEAREVPPEEVERRMKGAEEELRENIGKTDYVIYNSGKTKQQIIEEVRDIILKYL